MNPRLRQFLIYAGTAIGSIWMAWQAADESYFWPALALLVAVTAILVRLFRLPADIIILGLVMFGYLVGNRGFAQLTPSPGIPLLPAEATLLFAGSWALIACAFERRLPWRNNALNWFVLGWLVCGTSRVLFDLRAYRLEAVRDYATVYYAVFFFLIQRVAHEPQVRTYLVRCAVTGLCLLPVLNALFEVFPQFFYTHFRINGVPMFMYKGDLAYMFQAVGAVLLFHWARGRQRYWAWPYAVLMFLNVMSRESRSSILACFVVLLMLIAARRWLFPLVQLSFAGLAAAAVLLIATFTNNAWAGAKMATVEAHLYSIFAPIASVNHQADRGAYKWDNNRFRLVWWRSVALETIDGNPVFGLGFGHDLARNFVQEYNPEMAEDFTARSPHSIALTAFGRMGAVGLVVWLGLCLTISHRTWRALRTNAPPLTQGIWCGLLIIIIAALLGVVLEGPMGAVPFWILLGLASATGPEPASTDPTAPALPPAGKTASPA